MTILRWPRTTIRRSRRPVAIVGPQFASVQWGRPRYGVPVVRIGSRQTGYMTSKRSWLTSKDRSGSACIRSPGMTAQGVIGWLNLAFFEQRHTPRPFTSSNTRDLNRMVLPLKFARRDRSRNNANLSDHPDILY